MSDAGTRNLERIADLKQKLEEARARIKQLEAELKELRFILDSLEK